MGSIIHTFEMKSCTVQDIRDYVSKRFIYWCIVGYLTSLLAWFLTSTIGSSIWQFEYTSTPQCNQSGVLLPDTPGWSADIIQLPRIPSQIPVLVINSILLGILILSCALSCYE